MKRRTYDAQGAVKNVLTSIIKHISVIAIFVALVVVFLTTLMPEIFFNIDLITELGVPSVFLGLSNLIIYELWVTNGKNNAREEKEYDELLKRFNTISDGIHYPTMQTFLDYERKRRYDVEYDRLSRIITREESMLVKFQNSAQMTFLDKIKIKSLEKRVSRLKKHRDRINIKLPYEKSEEFDYLRYNSSDAMSKEYKPDDVKTSMQLRRTKKYITLLTFTLVGINIINFGVSTETSLIPAIIMTLISACTLLFSVVSGFSNGYYNINVVSKGVYKTAISYIEQAVGYFKNTENNLYYKEPVVEPEEKSEDTPEVKAEVLLLEDKSTTDKRTIIEIT